MSRLTRFLRSVCTRHIPSSRVDVPRLDGAATSVELPPVKSASRHGDPPPLQRQGFPVAVCWSAKSGCTTVLKWFLAQNSLLDEALAYNDWIHAYRQDKLFASHDYLRECEQLFANTARETTIIKVIRDPATRAVSSFLHFVRYIEADEHSPAAAFVTDWKSAVGLSGQQGLSFQQFLRYVSAQQLKGAPLDPHFRPQYDATQDAKVDTYVRLEDLSSGLRSVEDRCGLPHVQVGQLSISPHHNPATAQHAWPTHAARFPADHATLDECGTPPAQAFLDPETRMLIRTAYRTDYAAYGHLYDAAPLTTRRTPGTDRETTAQDIHQPSLRVA